MLMIRIYNRPISPHLTVYSPQLSSLFSIWHRISGVLLTVTIFLSLYSLKLTIWWLSFGSLYFVIENNFIFYIVFFTILTSFCYHLLNGLRHILWDFNLFLTNNSMFFSSFFILSLVFSFQILGLKFFIY
uniref:Succinate:cytochrome c oxidoreductase subunit 3 n=1 Tax=Sirodotia delicatula TaxID=386631 RepID=A0A343UY48_9FLOR|nr:succinate:cytochrome c oxidoreductase subunit 3 [Sirodotia delicatula]AVK39605.1 succinate:cytochrome c oxidoreductase subunit 3 [Sirodotia delicatula]